MGSAQIQGELWGRAAGDWATLQEPMHMPVWKAMLNDVGVDEGTRFFDAGCGGGPFALSASGALDKLVEQAGWKVIGDGEAECPFEYPNMETFWRAQRAAGPLQAQIESLGEERLRAAVEQAVEPYRTKTGGVRLENCFRFVTATT